MFNIIDKVQEINLFHKVQPKEIFINRKYKDDSEWLVLDYMVECLKLAKEEFPVYATKEQPPEADFITYDSKEKIFRPIEVTEIMEFGRRRDAEYKGLADINDLYKEEEAAERKGHMVIRTGQSLEPTFMKCFENKFKMRYSKNTWLLIYHNVRFSKISNIGNWHSGLVANAEIWFYSGQEKYQDICKPPYEKILVVDSSGKAMVEIYPNPHTIVEADRDIWS